jgi:hypothetical protein
MARYLRLLEIDENSMAILDFYRLTRTEFEVKQIKRSLDIW